MAVSPPKAPPKTPPRATVAFDSPPPAEVTVPAGLAATREHVRRRGWLAGLLLPVVVVATAAIVLEIPSEGHIANVLGVTGSLLALLAVPTAVAFGIPVEVGPVPRRARGGDEPFAVDPARMVGRTTSVRTGRRRMARVGDRVRMGRAVPVGGRAHRRRRPAASRVLRSIRPEPSQPADRASRGQCLAPRAADRPR